MRFRFFLRLPALLPAAFTLPIVACGLGTVGTTASNNAGSASVTTTAGIVTATGTETDATAAANTTSAQGTTATAPATTGTSTTTAPGTTTPAATTPVAVTSTPVTGAPIAPVATAPANPNTTTQDSATTPTSTKPFYDTQKLSTAIFAWNEQTGAFTAILSTETTDCFLRTNHATKLNGRELQITANVKQSGSALTLTNISATMVQFDALCRVGETATMGSGPSSLNLSNLSASSVSGNYSFTLSMGNDGQNVVAGSFNATYCAGLVNGIPEGRVCLY